MNAPAVLALSLIGPLLAAHGAAAEEPLFPFVVSYEPGVGVTNVSAWLERPAGKHGFVRVEKQGPGARLATEAGPIRFWATNLCFEACFPSREQAERLAARLAGLGINCVRMHHMDNYSIWGDSKDHTTIDPKKLDRLDYLIHQLKEHGIYTNINLHVSRWLDARDGFPLRDQRPHYDKGLGNFEPRMIELQKKYARDLLTHVNPYTKTAYAQEPAVAFVEISNEDALFAEWGGGSLDNLPDPYAATFRKLWNAWLRKKHGTTEKLRQAWKAGEHPLGEEMLAGGDFSRPFDQHWHMERDEQTGVEWSVIKDGGPQGKPALRVVVTRNGQVAWRPQFSQAKLAVKKGTPYTLSFSVRGEKAGRIGTNCMMAHDPWERLGLSADAPLTAEWTEHRFTFVAEQDDENARITFTELEPGTYELAGVSLRPGGIVGLARDQRLEDDSVPVLLRRQMNLTAPARADFIDFLWDTERDYWFGMYRYLKDELGVKPLVSGTQLSYSPAYVQAGLDYIDAHSYWQHPHFPGRPWDANNWTVRNTALVNTLGGTLAGLAERRVEGMAFTVSEYNHPAPNVYAAEGFPMIAAFGAFQGWDGIFTFCYSHSTDFEPRKITGFFDIKSDPSRLVHSPACAAMFLRGDVRQAKETAVVPVSREEERKKLGESMSAWTITAGRFGLDPLASLRNRIGMKLAGEKTERAESAESPRDNIAMLSDTGEILWSGKEKGAGHFTVCAPRAKLFTGFVRAGTFDLGDVKLTVGKTRLDWATISMTAIDGKGFDSPGRVLIAATGWVQNTGWDFKELGGENVTLGNRWGNDPVLCEGVPAEITLPVPAARVTFYPLDESGNRRQPVPVSDKDGRAVVVLGPKHKTLWYEVEIK